MRLVAVKAKVKEAVKKKNAGKVKMNGKKDVKGAVKVGKVKVAGKGKVAAKVARKVAAKVAKPKKLTAKFYRVKQQDGTVRVHRASCGFARSQGAEPSSGIKRDDIRCSRCF